jgi:hypothetical protein
MPVMGGLETAEAIRKHPAYGEVPIFFLTGQTNADLPRQAYEAGCNLFLRKPVDPIQILKCIDRFLKDTGLKPGQFHKHAQQLAQREGAPAAAPAPGPQAAPRRPAAPAPAPATAPANVRVLVIEADPEQQARLCAFFAPRGAESPRVPGGPFDLIQAEEFSLAMGNLSRWEPDLILYNPRLSRGLDAVAFGQMVLLAKLAKMPEIIFAGKEFYESEIEYSRAKCKRGVLMTDAGDQATARLLADAVTLARRNPAPKRTPFARIATEEAERRRVQNVQDEREARQREELRRRYANIQTFINEQMI